jgi:hypothetical protein
MTVFVMGAQGSLTGNQEDEATIFMTQGIGGRTVSVSEAGFSETKAFPWTFIPRGDMPLAMAHLLEARALVGQWARVDSHRGGLGACAWKGDFDAR